MPASFLTVNYNAGGTPIISLYRPDSFIPVAFWGNSFGTLDSGTSNSNVAFNRIIKFYGQTGASSAMRETFYAVAADTIYRSFDYGFSWTAVYTLSPFTSTTINKSGLNIVNINGVAALCIMWYNQGTAQWFGAFSYDGATWTRHGPFSLGIVISNGLTSDTVYNNSLYCTTAPGNNGSVIIYSPGSETMAGVSLSGPNSGGCACLAEFNSRLFCLFTRSSASDSQLAEIISSGAQTITTSIHGSGNLAVGNMCALFVDQNVNRLYGIFHGPTGFVAYEWTSALSTPTNITSTVLPASLITCPASARLLALVDDVEISGYPQIYLYYADDGVATTVWTPLRWNGPNQQMTSATVAAIGTVGSAMPANRTSAGAYFWYPYSTYSIITGRTYIDNAIRFDLKLYGTSTNNNSFRAFFAVAGEEYPTRPCTLSNPTSGTVIGGNIVRNIVAGTPSGVDFSVTWEAGADGLTDGAGFKFICENFLL